MAEPPENSIGSQQRSRLEYRSWGQIWPGRERHPRPGWTLQQRVGPAFVRQQRLDFTLQFGIIAARLAEERFAFVRVPFERRVIERLNPLPAVLGHSVDDMFKKFPPERS